MKKLFLVFVLAGAFSGAQATCVGSEAMQSCFDDSGNTYYVQRMGNTTMVQGSNAGTGSTWNQTSSTMGNMTVTNGTAANGNSWNQTTTTMPGMVQTTGTDSDGNSFSKTCTSAGCF